MKEIILAKYGEIILKGGNRPRFESILINNINNATKNIAKAHVRVSQATVYVDVEDPDKLDVMVDRLSRIFGLVSITRAAVCEKDIEKIKETAKEYLAQTLTAGTRFKVEAKRSDKKFTLNSPQICMEVGGYLDDEYPDIIVDVHNPDATIKVEVREDWAYVYCEENKIKGQGGMPIGTGSKATLLLSGGIDSPVAGHMMAKRGMNVECLHFHSYPYTNMQAKEKVVDLAKILSEYTGGTKLYTVKVTHIQESIHENCKPELMITLLRRFMYRIAERFALRIKAQCLITGESLGQVASQTIEGMTSSNSVVEKLPVLRPLVGFDKNEIIERSVKMGAYETSILPFEDCCTVFLPDFPAIRPKLCDILREEEKLDVEGLIAEAFESIEKIVI